MLPSVGSVLLVYPLTRRFLENKRLERGENRHGISGNYCAAWRHCLRNDRIGRERDRILDYLNKDMILYLLMFLVGISIGFNQGLSVRSRNIILKFL